MTKYIAPMERTRELGALGKRMIDLQDQLRSSLKLQAFEPRAFEHGSCKVGGRGNVRYSPRNAVITITLGNGEILEYPLLSVPFDLWPSSMRDEFTSIPNLRQKELKKEVLL